MSVVGAVDGADQVTHAIRADGAVLAFALDRDLAAVRRAPRDANRAPATRNPPAMPKLIRRARPRPAGTGENGGDPMENLRYVLPDPEDDMGRRQFAGSKEGDVEGCRHQPGVIGRA
ncbi:hypothetical protein Airi02_073760 [Actinoallomurus iriomotensis]|uniref:Uncharacterized protein n=1 Tax=Actinoallomurus iriomotensis TaxID=478107 RepID=A0A9W6SBF4_9ACTN|nr:hypothetical protein Airi02_073760 [Actinoallomurus iriomotensis]